MKKLLLCIVVVPASFALAASVATVDFAQVEGRINPALHSSGWTPRSTNGSQTKNPDIDIVKSMNFAFARTHDWALVNAGQHVVDYHFIFPLMHLDATDPKNYCFGPTDHLLGMSREAGLEIFYRLGTSIEHTGPKVHFNSAIPEDFDKMAEIFAATVRHYNRGWANGKMWNIRYWEIWNEPDGQNNMWSLPDGDEGYGPLTSEGEAKKAKRRALFCAFYAKCLKRIKSEFPEVKVGGPALCEYQEDYFQQLFDACKESGTMPDFISWHYYGNDPDGLPAQSLAARGLCDRNGLKDCELVVNEWHYMDSRWSDLRSANPAVSARVQDGPTGHNNIDSAAFVLGNLIGFQTKSKFDIACYYGCEHAGHWGYMNDVKDFNKVYYACRLFGRIVKDYSAICAAGKVAENYYVLPVIGKAGDKKALLVVDFRNVDQVLEIDIKGLGAPARASARVLDHTRDDIPCACDFMEGKLRLVKPDKYSAAFFVQFSDVARFDGRGGEEK